MAGQSKERFGNANDGNPNWVDLKQKIKDFATQFHDTEDIPWPKPQNFAESNSFQKFDTTDFRHRYNKAKEEFMSKYYLYFQSIISTFIH